jgi:hypothetical protein
MGARAKMIVKGEVCTPGCDQVQRPRDAQFKGNTWPPATPELAANLLSWSVCCFVPKRRSVCCFATVTVLLRDLGPLFFFFLFCFFLLLLAYLMFSLPHSLRLIHTQCVQVNNLFVFNTRYASERTVGPDGPGPSQ